MPLPNVTQSSFLNRNRLRHTGNMPQKNWNGEQRIIKKTTERWTVFICRFIFVWKRSFGFSLNEKGSCVRMSLFMLGFKASSLTKPTTDNQQVSHHTSSTLIPSCVKTAVKTSSLWCGLDVEQNSKIGWIIHTFPPIIKAKWKMNRLQISVHRVNFLLDHSSES